MLFYDLDSPRPLYKDWLVLIVKMSDTDDFVKVCEDFYSVVKHEQSVEEGRMQKTVKLYEEKIKKMKEETDEMYQNLLQWMIEHAKHEDNHTFLRSVSKVLKDVQENPGRMDMYAEIMRESVNMAKTKRGAYLCEDNRQFLYGKKPLYFNFDF
jgi:hypothetical protein